MKQIHLHRPPSPNAFARRLKKKHGIPDPIARVFAELNWGNRRE